MHHSVWNSPFKLDVHGSLTFLQMSKNWKSFVAEKKLEAFLSINWSQMLLLDESNTVFSAHFIYLNLPIVAMSFFVKIVDIKWVV